MEQNLCIESSCATLWVQTREKRSETIGDWVEFALDNRFYRVDAESVTYLGDQSKVCYWGDRELTKNNIIYHQENPIPGNIISSYSPWDDIPTGTYKGNRLDLTNVDEVNKNSDRGASNGIARLVDSSLNEIVWEGDLTNAHAFLTRYQDESNKNYYDLNVIRGCAISQILTELTSEHLKLEIIERTPPKNNRIVFNGYKEKIYQIDRDKNPHRYYEVDTWKNLMPVLELGNSRPRYVGIKNPRQINIPAQWEKHEIKKLPWLEKIEVVPYFYNYEFGGFISFLNPRGDIPKNCLNVYVSSTQGNLLTGVLSPGNPSFISATKFTLQFCTDDPSDIKPPVYEVQCQCQEKCPQETCPIECLDHYCCYNQQGKSIKKIPKLLPPS